MTIIFIFLIGLCFGSFLNVVIDRIAKGQSIIVGRSYCDHCRKVICWYDLIPVVSFVILKGKCRFCHKKVSVQYPVVEIITAALFTFTYLFFISVCQPLSPHFQLQIIYHLIIVSGITAIFFMDLKYRIIADQILILLIISASLYLLIFAPVEFINHFLTAVVYFLIFLALVIFTRGRGMGLGDVKFSFVIGLILGYPNIIVSFYLCFLTGAAISLILIVMGQKSMKSTIPFGPFMAGSTFLAIFYGDRLWYLLKGIIGL